MPSLPLVYKHALHIQDYAAGPYRIKFEGGLWVVYGFIYGRAIGSDLAWVLKANTLAEAMDSIYCGINPFDNLGVANDT